MDRINIIKIKGAENPQIFDLKSLPSSDVHGIDGEIKRANFWGRSVTLQIGGEKIELNRGSVIDFLNAHKLLSEELSNENDLDRGICRGIFGGGDDRTRIQTRMDKVLKALTEIDSEDTFKTQRTSGKSWAHIQGEEAFKTGKYEAACVYLSGVNDPEAQYMRGLSFLKRFEQDNDRTWLGGMAISNFLDASDQGHMGAVLELANLYEKTGQHELALDEYELAAHRGSVEACEIVARKYMEKYINSPNSKPRYDAYYKSEFMKERGKLLKQKEDMGYEKGREFYNKGDYKSAIIRFESIYCSKTFLKRNELTTEEIECLHLLGLSYLKYADTDEVILDEKKKALRLQGCYYLGKAEQAGHIEAGKALKTAWKG